MKVAIREKIGTYKGLELGQTVTYDLDDNDEFDSFCSDLINIGRFHQQKSIEIITENKHYLSF